MGLIDRFLKDYLKDSPASAPEPTATAAELAGMLGVLKKANGELRSGQLTEAQRQVLRGKTSPLLTAMLAATVRGLQGAPKFATAIGADPGEVLHLLEQRMALTGAVSTLEVLKGRADGCWYWVADRAQREAQRLLDTVVALLGPEASRSPRQIALGGYFAQALRSHAAGVQRKSAPTEALAAQKAAQAQDLGAAKERGRVRELVRQMLVEIAEGKGLLPAAAAKDLGKDKG